VLDPSPTPPSPRRPVGLLITVGVIAALLAAGIVVRVLGDGPSTTASATATTPAPTTEAATASASPTPTWSAYTGELTDLLVPVPAGARATHISVASEGQQQGITITDDMTDIARSATLMSSMRNAQLQELLKRDGYVRGATRMWADQASNLVTLDVMAFDRPAGAGAFLTSARDDILGIHSERHDVMTEVNDGWWVEYVVDGDYQLRLLFSKNEFVVHLWISRPGTTNVELLRTVAVDQFQRLP